MRTVLLIIAALIISGCTDKQPLSEQAADQAMAAGIKTMKPVYSASQGAIDGLQRDFDERNERRKEQLRRKREGEPIRTCVIDGVKTFDNRGTLCPP